MWLQSGFLSSLVSAFEWHLGWYRSATLGDGLGMRNETLLYQGVTTLLLTYDMLLKMKECW